jgi:hypothetical protein
MRCIVRFPAALLLAAALSLSACVEGVAPYFVGRETTAPLPAEFVLHAEADGKQRAWRLRRDGEAWAWIGEKARTRTALVPLTGAPAGYFIAASWEGERAKALYGLVRLSPADARLFLFDAGKAATALGVPVESSLVSTRFAREDDLAAVFADMARRIPPDAAGNVSLGDLKIETKRFAVIDLADPALRAKGEALLAQFGKDPGD